MNLNIEIARNVSKNIKYAINTIFSYRRFSNKPLIQWCNNSATVAVGNIHLIRKYYVVTVNNYVQFQEMLNTIAIHNLGN